MTKTTNYQRLSPRQRELVKAFEVEGYHDEFRIAGSNIANNNDEHLTFFQPTQQLEAKAAVATGEKTMEPFLVGTVANEVFDRTFCVSLVAGAAVIVVTIFVWTRTSQRRGGARKGHKKGENFDNSHRQRNFNDDDNEAQSSTKDSAFSCKDLTSVDRWQSETSTKPECASIIASEPPKRPSSGAMKACEKTDPRHCWNNVDSSSTNAIDNSSNQHTVVPKLVEESSEPSRLPIEQLEHDGSIEPSSIARRQSVSDIKNEFRTEILANAVVYRQILEASANESGLQATPEVIATLSLQAAIAKRQSDAQLQAEFRGYRFEACQREIDRKLSERRHLESIRSFREDKDWFCKIVQARDECVETLRISLTRSFAVLLGFRPLLACFEMMQLWNHSVSFSDIVCRIISTVTACPSPNPSSPSIFQPGYWIQLIGDYGPTTWRAYAGASYCLVHNATVALILLGAFGATTLFVRLFSLPGFSTSVVVAFTFTARFSVNQFQKGSLVLLLTGVFSYCLLMAYFLMSRRNLQTTNFAPEYATVIKIQDHFLRARGAIEMLPLAVLLWLLASTAGMF